MKEEKIGLTPINWILSILGIIILICFIALPPIFRTYLKEEEEAIPEPVVIPTLTTTCYKDQINSNKYMDKETYIFKHKEDKIKEYTKETNRIYHDPLIYQQEKQSYGELVTAFSILTGYNYTATPSDNESSINIIESYDLEQFQPTMIVIPGNTEPTSVDSTYKLNEFASTIKQELTTNGYVCTQSN